MALSASARLPPALAYVSPRARALVEPSWIWLASVCTPEIMALPAILRHRRHEGPRLQIYVMGVAVRPADIRADRRGNVRRSFPQRFRRVLRLSPSSRAARS